MINFLKKNKVVYVLFLPIFLTLFLSLFVSRIKAEGQINCSTPPTLVWVNQPSTNIVPLNSTIKFQVKNSVPPNGYKLEYRIEDKSTGKVTILAQKTMTASESLSSIFSVSLNTAGDKSIYVYYKGTETSSCYETATNYYNFTVRSNQATDDNITINASGNVNQGQSKEIKFNAKNLSGWSAVLYINVGGKECINITGTETCWSEKWRKTLDSNNFSGAFTWETSSSTLLGPHPIKLEVFNGNSTAMKATSINVCDSSGKNCGENISVSTGTTGNTNTDEKLGGSSNTAKIGTFSNLNKTLTELITGNKAGKDMTTAELSDIKQVVIDITNYALDVAGVIAIIIILYSAFMYATAFGEESKAEAAKKALTWSIIGMFIIIVSKALMLWINHALKTGL